MVRIETISHPLKVVIDRTPRINDRSEAIEQAWHRLCAQNPRYFNGKILAFDSYNPDSGVIRASIEQYMHHAVRDVVDIGISLLAVTAILAAPDNVRNIDVYLLGKRSPQLHRYGGLWEFGPSGGIDVPRICNSLDLKEITAEIAREIKEEIGVRISSRPYAARALVHDEAVGSTDIAIPIVLDHVPAINTNWEYTETKWLTLKELYKRTQSNPDEFIPTTVAFAQHLYESRDP